MDAVLADKADRLRDLHGGPGVLVLLNAWDAASATALEAAGFPALATTSGGVVEALGYRDGEQAPVDEVLAAVRRICRALVEDTGAPINILLRTGAPPVSRLAELGVARATFGSGLMRTAVRAAREQAEAARDA